MFHDHLFCTFLYFLYNFVLGIHYWLWRKSIGQIGKKLGQTNGQTKKVQAPELICCYVTAKKGWFGVIFGNRGQLFCWVRWPLFFFFTVLLVGSKWIGIVMKVCCQVKKCISQFFLRDVSSSRVKFIGIWKISHLWCLEVACKCIKSFCGGVGGCGGVGWWVPLNYVFTPTLFWVEVWLWQHPHL